MSAYSGLRVPQPYDYNFIMFFLGENIPIYITIDTVSVSGSGSCPEDVPDTLVTWDDDVSQLNLIEAKASPSLREKS